MNGITLSLFLKTRDFFDQVLSSYGIVHRGVDRFHEAYRTLETFKHHHDMAASQGTMNVSGYEAKQLEVVIDAFHDCWELNAAMYELEDEDYEVCREKLAILLSGVRERYSPLGANSAGRNTLFELTLLADLKAAGMRARFGIDNPDIQVAIDDGNYFIECKRLALQSPRALENNLHLASKQLARKLPMRARGVIAISIGDYIIGDHVTLGTVDEKEAEKFVEDHIHQFIVNNQRVWTKKGVLGPHVVGIIFYASFVAVLEGYAIPQNLTFTLLSDPGSHATPEHIWRFAADFRRLGTPANGKQMGDILFVEKSPGL